MSQSVLSNSNLENKQLSPAQTKAKVTFDQDSITLSSITSATKCSLKNVAEPSVGSDVATKNYVNSTIVNQNIGLAWKNSVRVISNDALPANTYSSGTLEGLTNGALPSVDGVSLAVGDRLIVNSQTNKSQNGLYDVADLGDGSSKYVLNRSADADSASELQNVTAVATEGTTYGGSTWCEANKLQVLDTDNCEFVQTSTGINEVSVTDGLSKVGKYLQINVNAAKGIGIESDNLVIVDGGVDTIQLKDDSVSTAKYQAKSILEASVDDNAIIERCVLNGAITEDKLGPSAVTSSKLGSQACDTASIKNANVTTAKLQDDCVTSAKLNAGACDSDAIGTAVINSTHIGGGQLLASHYSNQSVGNSALAVGAVASTNLASNAVTTSKVSAGSITTAKLDNTASSEAVSNEVVRDDAITLRCMADASVGNSQLINSSVDASKLATGAVDDNAMGTLSSLNVNGPCVATSFVAGGSAGSSTFSLAKVKYLNVDFTTAYALTTSWDTVPHADCIIPFSWDDAVIMASCQARLEVATDATSNVVELIIATRFWEDENTAGANFYVSNYELHSVVAGSSNAELVMFSLNGNGDKRIHSIAMYARKSSAGVVSLPALSDFYLNAMCVSDDSSTLQHQYNNGVFT